MNDRLPLQQAHRVRAATQAPEPVLSMPSGYRRVRIATEQLAAPLSAEDCAIQSMPDASPVKWHLAHTSWFFETFVLKPHLPGYRLFHPSFRVLFNSYYNGIGDKHPRPRRGLLSRPSLEEVDAYRLHIDAAMAELMDRRTLPSTISALIELGLNHEQQHQELIFTDVLHLLSCNPLKPAYEPSIGAADAPIADASPQTWIEFGEGIVDIGHEGSQFAFDNESPRHRQYLNGFSLASREVTNGEYLATAARRQQASLANISPSSTTRVTDGRNCGSPKVGTGWRRTRSTRRSTGSATDAAGSNSVCTDSAR